MLRRIHFLLGSFYGRSLTLYIAVLICFVTIQQLQQSLAKDGKMDISAAASSTATNTNKIIEYSGEDLQNHLSTKKIKIQTSSTITSTTTDLILWPNISKIIDKETKMIALINSKPNSFTQRQVIRSTWGNSSVTEYADTILIFLLAKPKDVNYTEQIKKEASIYKDILMVNYTESYRKLLWKILIAYEFIINTSKHFKYLLKTDDDCYVNLRLITKELHQWESNNNRNSSISPLQTNKTHSQITNRTKNAIFCAPFKKQRPIRNPKSQYYVGEAEYSRKDYPTFCPGNFYIVTRQLATFMFQQTLSTNYTLHLDDVLMTGLLLEHRPTDLIRVNWWQHANYGFPHGSNKKLRTLFYAHGVTNNQKKILYNVLMQEGEMPLFMLPAPAPSIIRPGSFKNTTTAVPKNNTKKKRDAKRKKKQKLLNRKKKK